MTLRIMGKRKGIEKLWNFISVRIMDVYLYEAEHRKDVAPLISPKNIL